MNTKVQFFITLCLWSFSLLSSSDRPLTLIESIVIGGTCGLAEVAIAGQVLNYAMNQAIIKQPFNFRHSYRGFVAHAGGIMPITATYKAVQAQGTQFLQNHQQEPLTEIQKVGISGAAGTSAAVIDTASNAVQVFLQAKENAGKSTMQAYKEIGFKGLRRGYVANAFMKESPFAIALQVISPKITDVVKKYTDHEILAKSVSGCVTGVVTAIATQPGAVVRNKMQNDFAQTTYTSTVQTIQKICNEQGVKALFAGVVKRGGRLALAMPLYVVCGDALERKVKSLD